MRKFFAEKNEIFIDEIILRGENYRHIVNVLRMEVEDQIWISDGISKEYLSEIEEIKEDIIKLRIIESKSFESESLLKIHLCQGLPKSDKMDYIVQKNTELGIASIQPIAMDRCIVKLDAKKAAKKQARWQKIAEEASKQSKRNLIPEIKPLIKLDDWLESNEGKLIIVPYEDEMQVGLKDFVKKNMNVNEIFLFIGPEGGFEISEIEKLKSNDAVVVSLGKRILRTETAGIATNSILQYALGDMGL